MPKIFFATDLHGSETCWRKFINAAKFYDCDTLICGGDMTGKAIVPIVAGERTASRTTLGGDEQIVPEDQVAEVESQRAPQGLLPAADDRRTGCTSSTTIRRERDDASSR